MLSQLSISAADTSVDLPENLIIDPFHLDESWMVQLH